MRQKDGQDTLFISLVILIHVRQSRSAFHSVYLGRRAKSNRKAGTGMKLRERIFYRRDLTSWRHSKYRMRHGNLNSEHQECRGHQTMQSISRTLAPPANTTARATTPRMERPCLQSQCPIPSFHPKACHDRKDPQRPVPLHRQFRAQHHGRPRPTAFSPASAWREGWAPSAAECR